MRAYSALRFDLSVILFLTLSFAVNANPPSKESPTPEGTPATIAVGQSPSVDFYLHGTGPNDNPPTLFLNTTSPTGTTAKYKDSTSINFNGGNPWKEVGVWTAQSSLISGTLSALGDLHVWLGLKNSDDQGTNFDLRAEMYKNGVLVSSGVTLCVVGVTRNASNAKEVTVGFTPFSPATFDGATDVLSVKILTRIGTNGAGASCGGHSNAVGLRLYFDAGNRASRFNANFTGSGDVAAPTITAAVAPAPNAAGWNNSDPTVTFTCADTSSGIASCASPVNVTTETTSQTVVGTAIDNAGNTAFTSVSVKLDKTPPGLSVTSPLNGTSVFAQSVSLVGTVGDALSGIASVTCNGAPAVLSGNNFTCGVTLTSGANSIITVATDVAGNTNTSSLSVTFTRPPIVTITSPANLSYLNINPTTVSGTVDDPTATVTVNSVQAAVVNGNFSLALPLAEGPNVVTASAASGTGAVGTSSIGVTLDTTPPHVTITSPPDQFVTTDASISIAGSVNDIVVGTVNSEQAQVAVNGVTAQVANRTFLATNVPLSMGTNVIQAVGRDRVGNAATTQIVVTRQTPALPHIRSVSGNNQTGAIGSLLPVPLVVAVTDAAGNPVADKPVIFKVVQNDGMVNAGGPPAPTVIATTNSLGQAQVQWKLGMRAGSGGNSVEAYSVGFTGTAIFTATGTQGPPGKIVIDTGNDQIGSANQPLAKPLIAVVVDAGNNRLVGVPVTFTVTQGGGSFGGQPAFTVNSDSDGRVAATLTLGSQEGNANNLVEATFASNTGLPASFTASGRASGDPANTTISGVVLDNSNVPIPGVTIRAVLTNLLNSNSSIIQSVAAVQTDAQGQFSIPQAPVGFVKLLVDGSTAQRPGAYPTLDYDLVTVAGRNNTLSQPIYLLALNANNQLCVTATTGGGTLSIPEAPGFSLTFGPGQVTFPGGSQTGCVSVTVVHGDKVPMVPGFGQQPRFIVTIQPAGAIFNPPAAITLPNVDGLPPRAVTEMYSFDHDIGSFVAIGTGVVSDDGRVIRSSPGVGVLKAGWHCGGNPNGTGSAASLSVTINPTNIEKSIDKEFSVTANGTPALDGSYSWEIIATEQGDDPSIATLLQSPACSNQPSCTAVVKGVKVGKATLRVHFICSTTGLEATADSRITIATPDVVVVSWVDSSAITLPSGASFLLKIDLNTPLVCSALLLDWVVGIPTDLFGSAEVDYANAFLLIHSGNNRPPSTIDPDSTLAGGDFRLFNRFQASFSQQGGAISNLRVLKSSAVVGTTPDPCGLVPNSSGEAHPSNGANGVTSSGTGVFQLAEGRLGSIGQRVNQTINGRTTPWIWSVIRFDAFGALAPVDHSIFPTHFVYKDGALTATFPQSAPAAFIIKDATYQRLPSEVP